MAQIFNERFEGATNGTGLTTGNTTYGTINATNVTLTFDSSTSAAGALSCKVVQTAAFGTGNGVTAAFTATSTLYRRFAVRMTALPSGGNLYIASCQTGGTVVARMAIDSTGHFIIQNGTTTIATSTNALATSTWYRLEWDLVGTTATLRIYSSPSSTSPVETISGTMTGSTFTTSILGIVGSANTTVATIWFDEEIADTAATPGPISRAATATAAIVLTASGTATAPATATASLTLTASGTMSGTVSYGDSVMGPGSTAGQPASDALQDVASTELGLVFVNGAGQIVFRPRHSRYNPQSAFTFGEQELPYTDLGFGYDTSHLTNQVTVSRPNGTTVTVNDLTSQKSYYVHNVSFTLQLNADVGVLDAANYLLSRYTQPSLRVTAMVLKPVANAALWPAVLSAELSTCVTVNRRPPGTQAIQQVTFVDHLEHTVDFSNGGTWTTTVVCTPADVTKYLVWDAGTPYGLWDNNSWAY